MHHNEHRKHTKKAAHLFTGILSTQVSLSVLSASMRLRESSIRAPSPVDVYLQYLTVNGDILCECISFKQFYLLWPDRLDVVILAGFACCLLHRRVAC